MKKLSQLTDEELALEYVAGSNRAFDELLSRTRTGLYSYIIFIVQNQELADDLFQETYLKVITKLQMHKYVPTGKFNAWLIRIAHNTIMDWYRRQKTHSFIDTSDDCDIATMSDDSLMESSHENFMNNMQVLDDVTTMVKYLPETQQQIVHMRYFLKMSFKDIAETTGTSINTCLGRMRYALINLRRLAKENNMQLQLA